MNEKRKQTISANKHVANPVEWVENHADYLYSFALSRLNDEEQAQDLVQDTFLAALEKVAVFEGKSNERTWLTAILKHKIIDIYRRKASGLENITATEDAEQEQIPFFDVEDGHWNIDHRPKEFVKSADDPLLSKEFQSVLQKCLQKLPSLWLSVFSMKHLDETATDKICAELKVSSANFWVIIHRTKLNLRACLQKNWI